MTAKAQGQPAPVRLMIICHDAGLSGAERSLLEIIDHLPPEQFAPVVLVPSSGPFVEALRSRSIACHRWLAQRWIHYRKQPPAHNAGILPRIKWWLRHPMLRSCLALLTLPLRLPLLMTLARWHKAELIYSNTITVLDGALVARLLKLPHVWHLRESVHGNTDLYWPGPASWLPSFIVRNATHVIVNSRALRRELFGDDAKSVTIIPNGVAIENTSVDRMAERSGEIHGETAPRTAIIGRLNPRKGIPIYLAALAPVIQRYPNSRHFIVGDGHPEYVGFLHREAQRLGVFEHVVFTGFQVDIRPLLAELDVLVNASYQEPFGRTLIEAMAAAVPVIATRSGGPEEIIEDGHSGLLVDINDSKALAEGILLLLDDHNAAERLGKTGQERVREHFNLTCTTASVIALLCSLRQ